MKEIKDMLLCLYCGEPIIIHRHKGRFGYYCNKCQYNFRIPWRLCPPEHLNCDMCCSPIALFYPKTTDIDGHALWTCSSPYCPYYNLVSYKNVIYICYDDIIVVGITPISNRVTILSSCGHFGDFGDLEKNPKFREFIEKIWDNNNKNITYR